MLSQESYRLTKMPVPGMEMFLQVVRQLCVCVYIYATIIIKEMAMNLTMSSGHRKK